MDTNPNGGTGNREIIVKLISEELKSYKLTSGLCGLGIPTEQYYTDLGSIILTLMGFEESDIEDYMYTFFQESIEKIAAIEKNEFHSCLPSLSQGVYESLLREKDERAQDFTSRAP